jgi:hypothetical protein
MNRLGDFSPVGEFITMGSFVKITEVARIYVGLLFSTIKLSIHFGKSGLGYILGHFDTNSPY